MVFIMWPLDPVTKYAIDVVENRIVAGPFVRAACRRHLNDLKRNDLYFDLDAVRRVFKFFSGLKLAEGQFDGEPFVLHPSQEFIIGSIFGWMRLEGHSIDAVRCMSYQERAIRLKRRFRRAYIEQGKGNGKSPLVAGIGLYGMLADREPGAQIYSAAATRDQADIMFQDAVKMASAHEGLMRRIRFSGNAKVYNMVAPRAPQKNSFFRPLARTAGKTGSGLRPHMALCDEVHEHPDKDIIEILERGFKWRRQPLLVMITNSGHDRQSKCWAEHQHAVNVALGDVEDDTEFSYVCALDEGDEPFDDPSCWVKANPLLGVTITEGYLTDVVDNAIKIPANENNVRRLHFCQWTESEQAWISRLVWEACEDETLNLDDLIGRKAWGGLDLSSTKDLSARSLVFEDGTKLMEDGRELPCFILWCHGYTPRDTLYVRGERDKAPYDLWVKQGFLTATPGKVIGFSYIINDMVQDGQKFDVQMWAYDAYLHPRFSQDMGDMGVTLPEVEHPQGFGRRRDTHLWMPGSVDSFETLILENRIRIFINPVLRSAVAGAKFVESPAGLKRFDKQKATQRIDPTISSTMAVGAATTEDGEEDLGPSIYEQRAQAGELAGNSDHKSQVQLSAEDLERQRQEFERNQQDDEFSDWWE